MDGTTVFFGFNWATNILLLAWKSAAGAGPWLLCLTLAFGRALPSPACTRSASELSAPLRVLAWAAWLGLLASIPLRGIGMRLMSVPWEEVPTFFPAALSAGLWLAGLAYLERTARRTRRGKGMAVGLLTAGLFFLAADTILLWPFALDASSLPDEWRPGMVRAGAVQTALHGLRNNLGLAAALALAWQLRQRRSSSALRRATLREPDEALPARWFASVAAAGYAGALFYQLRPLVERFLLLREISAWLTSADITPLLPSLFSALLTVICIVSWLLTAVRPARGGRRLLALFPLFLLAARWLTRSVFLAWADWKAWADFLL